MIKIQAILDLADSLETDYKVRDDRMDEAEGMYDIQAWNTAKHPMEDRLASPIGHNVVNILTAMTVAAKTVVDVPAVSDNKTDRERASRAEDFARALVYWNQRELSRRLQWDAAFFAYLRGSFATFCAYDPEALRGLRMEIRDPRTAYPLFNRGRLEKLIIKEERKIGFLREELGMPKLLPEYPETEAVDWVEYWDKDYKAFFVDGKAVVNPTEHKMGFLPWGWFYGWGTPLSKPERQSYSILYAMYDLWKSMNRVATYIATASKNAVLSGMIINGEFDIPQGMTLEQMLQQFTQPGALIYNPNPERPLTATPIMNSRLPPETSQMLGITQRWLDESGVPSVVYGVEPSGITAAIGIQALLSGPKAKLSPFIASVERGMSWILEHALLTCKNHYLIREGETLEKLAYIVETSDAQGYHKLRRIAKVKEEDIDDDIMVDVRIGDIMPKDNVAIATVANVLATSRLLSRRDVRKDFLSREDPDADADNLLEEEILGLPAMKTTIALILAAQRGLPLEPLLQEMGAGQQQSVSRGVTPGEIGPGGQMVSSAYQPPMQPPMPNQVAPPMPMGGPMMPPQMPGRPVTPEQTVAYLMAMQQAGQRRV